ncbi:MAG: hypothetical protein H7288_22920 [Kineosporiaceae bacterium]|nr:hypothetical protein [Aeromicrobium sp.]
MPDDADEHLSDSDGFTIIFAARKIPFTVLLALPGLIASAACTGLLATFFFNLSTAVVIALAAAVGGVISLSRVLVWTRLVAPRVLATSETHLAVRRGKKTLTEMPWADIDSVRLIRGDSLLRMTFDFISDDADFPQVVAKSSDVWDDRGFFPPLLVVLPKEFERLESALRDACAPRELPFSVADDH